MMRSINLAYLPTYGCSFYTLEYRDTARALNCRNNGLAAFKFGEDESNKTYLKLSWTSILTALGMIKHINGVWEPVTAHKALGGGLRISKALVKGKALAKGTSKALADFSHASRRYRKQ
ncbi:hypothetical protein B0H19DRAFT_1063115 [Mycena capillaripes]|nr:hypothetical protein B0H19DRAFT_1063115 [Mycena capillaripes]